VADYSKSYDGAAKDAAQSAITGADFDTEFSAIETAITTKSNKIGSPTNGNLTEQDANGDLVDSGVAIGAVTTTELGYVVGVTSSIQDQLDKLAGWSFVSTYAASGASVDITGLSADTTYLCVLNAVIPVDDSVTPSVRFYSGGWVSGTGYRSTRNIHTIGVGSSYTYETSTSLIRIGFSTGNGSSEGIDGSLVFYNKGVYPVITSEIIETSRATDSQGYLQNTAVTGIQFYFSSGNISSGSIDLYQRA